MAESTPTVSRWTPTRKAAVVLEPLCGREVVELARPHGLSQAQLFAWRERFLEGGQAALKTRRGQIALELERQVGQLTVENEILKKTDELIRQRGRRSNG